ncbi:MAG: N-acetylmuramoyl-L-alanine amidase [Elusimicrobia bacterium]|nr:MAG: N-acetylmuramoyl-L-alanine amidase [Elusimicrobiota bacterium]
MTKPLRVLLAGLLAAAFAAGLSPRASAGEIEVVKGGKYWGKVDTYDAGSDVYLGLKEASKVYGAQLYWYSASGEVSLTLRGRPVVFKEESDEVSVDGKPGKLPRPMLTRVGRVFIPVEFLSDPAFEEVSGLDSKFNAKTRLLLVDARSNVGPLRWFTYPDHTRIVLELSEGLGVQADRRGVGGYEVSIPNGVIDWSERVEVKDGVVDAVHLSQDSRQARLSVALLEGADGVKQMELQKPRRLVLDVARRKGTSRDEGPAGATLPEAPESIKPEQPKAAVAKAPAEVPKVNVKEVPEAGPKEAVAVPAKPPVVPMPAKVKPAEKARYRIAVDAGHGGKDGGATGRRGTLEKDINLYAALELAKLLEEEGRFEVMLVRQDDTFVKLGERAKMANDAQADLFVSLHSNAHPSRAESGFEVYFLSERASDPEAERLAEFENSVLSLETGPGQSDEAEGILYQLARTEFMNDAGELSGLVAKNLAGRVDLANRGVKQAAFYVLRGVNAPAVLVEMGYLSNERDEAKLESAKYRRRLVEGLYAGIVEFYNRRAGGER